MKCPERWVITPILQITKNKERQVNGPRSRGQYMVRPTPQHGLVRKRGVGAHSEGADVGKVQQLWGHTAFDSSASSAMFGLKLCDLGEVSVPQFPPLQNGNRATYL